MKTKIAILIAIIALLAGLQPVLGAGRTWVIFRDRGYTSPDQIRQAIESEKSLLLPATRNRLLKVRSEPYLLRENDLPIYAGYLQEIERVTGLKPHALCRAINGASYAFTPQQIEVVKALPFVQAIRPVRVYQGDAEPEIESPALPQQGCGSTDDSLLYGQSYIQNNIENFVPAQEAGYHGEGVFVGQLDAGWNNLAHRCFDNLEIIATYDFVNHDSIVYPVPGDSGSFTHGTKTLSCFAGYDPGHYIGTAYGVHVALARTEYDFGPDYSWEEDDWAAGIEWLDSLGVVVATSSLSYGTLHTYPELNGDSTVVTKAADNAVARGVVVVNSAGNHGGDPYPQNKISPPSDGDSVMAIGAINADLSRAYFSSMGPTYDERIKPDLMALGSGVLVASISDTISYTYGSGTSFSTPLTAGACALLLQADSTLTPMQVQGLLKAHATQAHNPDTLMGWGIYNVWQSMQDVLYVPNPPKEETPTYQLISVFANPINPSTVINYHLPTLGPVRLTVWDTAGRLVTTLVDGVRPPGTYQADFNGAGLASGIYLVRLEAGKYRATQKMVLLK